MRAGAALAMLAALTACQPRAPLPVRHGIVSIDYCADQMLLGLVRPDGGEALLLGRPVSDPLARTRVGYLPELFRYQPWLTAAT